MTGEQPSLCIKGCGFYSTSHTKNLCSKCYNDFLKDESAKYLAVFTETTAEATETAAEAAAAETAVVASKKKEKKKKSTSSSRCNTCKKKVGLLGFQCRCGHVYCGSHRYPEEHSCPADYKTAAINDLIIQNPVIKGDKLFRI